MVPKRKVCTVIYATCSQVRSSFRSVGSRLEAAWIEVMFERTEVEVGSIDLMVGSIEVVVGWTELEID